MKEISLREAIREAIREEMIKFDNLFMIGQNIGPYGGEDRISGDLYSEFGDWRIRDAAISEQGIMGCAIGAAITNCRVIVDVSFMDFIALSADQIINQAAKFHYTFGGQMNVPLVVRTAMGGYINAASQHSQCLEALFMNIPGLKLVVPSTPYDTKGLLKASIRDNNPVIFITHKLLYKVKEKIPEEEYIIPLGLADIKKEGSDITIIATSYMVHLALEVANKLEKDGISIEVIDPRTLVPLDKDTIINSVKKTGKVIIIHEAPIFGGSGGEIAAIIADEAFDYLDAPIKRIGSKNTPVPFTSILENFVLPTKDNIEEKIKELLK